MSERTSCSGLLPVSLTGLLCSLRHLLGGLGRRQRPERQRPVLLVMPVNGESPFVEHPRLEREAPEREEERPGERRTGLDMRQHGFAQRLVLLELRPEGLRLTLLDGEAEWLAISIEQFQGERVQFGALMPRNVNDAADRERRTGNDHGPSDPERIEF